MGDSSETRSPIVVDSEEFSTLMRAFRERDKRSKNNLAYEVGIDPSYLTRIERGSREPPRQHIVFAIGKALKLNPLEFNRFLTSAGYSPLVAMAEGANIHWNDTFQAVADVLNSYELPDEAKESFRNVVETVAAMWLAKGHKSNGSSLT